METNQDIGDCLLDKNVEFFYPHQPSFEAAFQHPCWFVVCVVCGPQMSDRNERFGSGIFQRVLQCCMGYNLRNLFFFPTGWPD